MIRSLPVAEVAVNVPISKCFHYLVPPGLQGTLREGHRVLVPFGARTTTGVCVGLHPSSTVKRLKPIRDLLHPGCRFDEHILELTRWIAEYYHAGWGEVLEAALPPPVRSGKPERRIRHIEAVRTPDALRDEAARIARRAPGRSRLLSYLSGDPGPHPRSTLLGNLRLTGSTLKRAIEDGWAAEREVEDARDPYAEDLLEADERVEHELHADQARAIGEIEKRISESSHSTFLLHGVTGSGKTEIYLRALRDVIRRGGRGLVLVPEIALTPQAVLRFRQALPGVRVAVLHSMLSQAERTAQWKDIQDGRASVVIGARSAVFAPIPELRLVVVDEEHEPTYKQESTPRYNARDVAVMRAHRLGIPAILGSATPALESYTNALRGKYQHLELPRRATRHDLPLVAVVPLDGEYYRTDGSGLISPQLDHFIRNRLKSGEQVLIYLNRRGFATFLHCIRCGFVMKCDHCDVTLTFHRREDCARCHYCGVAKEIPRSCPDCGMPGPRRSGVGTEKVVTELARRYGEARIARLDRDAVTTHRALRDTVSRFRRGEYDLLVGTQMVAKGHDFPRVSLVGIINADTSLHFPDFRAAERTFQLITQVAGRAGRGERLGRVIVQTFFPDHYAIRLAVEGDYEGFYQKDMQFREALGYPPCGRLVRVLVSGKVEERVHGEAQRVGDLLRGLARKRAEVLGPAPSAIARIQDRYRCQVLVKSKNVPAVHEMLRAGRDALAGRRGVDVSIDVDPQSML